jgi:PKD repeat protein
MAVGGWFFGGTWGAPHLPSPIGGATATNAVSTAGPRSVLSRDVPSNTQYESGAKVTHDAIASLARGRGPADGRALLCVASSMGSGSCGGEGTPLRASAIPAYGFQHGTEAGSAPPFYGASLSWDADDGYVVYFGGLNTTNDQLQNATWLYGNGAWTNATAAVGAAPPARYLASMAFDEYDDEMVLTGGCGVTQCPLPDTWVFHGLEWFNDTMTGGCPCLTAGGGVYAASMTAWAGTDNGTFLFGGCLDRACDDQSNASFSFQQSIGCAYSAESYPCWVELSTLRTPGARAGAAVSVFQDNGTVLLYGGYRFVHDGGSTYSFATLNDTWTFDGATTSWTNRTFPDQHYESDEYPEAPRSNAALFWDPYLGSMFLFGGSNTVPSTHGAVPSPTNPRADLWEFYAASNEWVNETGYATPSVLRTLPAFADSVDAMPPVLVGGETVDAVPLNDSWVWEGPLEGTLTPTPAVAETNTTVVFTPSFLQAVLPSESSGFYDGTIFFGDGASSALPSATHEYSVPGTYEATMHAFDFFGVPNVTSVSVAVQLFTDHAKATPNATDVGAGVGFSAVATGGAGGYTYDWSFSGGGTASGASVTHAFAATGIEYGIVSANDTTGTTVNETVPVLIDPLPTADATASRSTADVGVPVTFFSAAAGGTAPFSYEWRFGDGTSSMSVDPTHTFAVAGSYTVALTVNDSSIGTVATAVAVLVDPPLVASASAATTSSAPGQAVTFSSSTEGGDAPYAYSWNFGDAGTATTSEPVHVFRLAGTYVVNVWINDTAGGEYHTSLTITVATVAPAGLPSSTGGLPIWVWVAITALAAGAILASLLLGTRRSRRAPPVPPPPPPPSLPPPPSPAAWEEGPPPPPAS